MRLITLCTAALVLSGAAFADTAYVKPSTFNPEVDQVITVEVAFNDYCCEPRYAVQTDTYRVIAPDGSQSVPDRTEVFKTTTMLEHKITQPGTTRITTGERLGRKGEYVLLDGEYHLVNSRDAEPIDVPAGTPVLTSQTATVTDAYVTAGRRDWKAVGVPVGRLQIEPGIHPNAISVDLPFVGKVTLDGKPLVGEIVTLTNEGERLRGVGGRVFETDEKGRFKIDFEEPGVHLIMVRIQAPAPDGAETDIRSYTSALTINVKPE